MDLNPRGRRSSTAGLATWLASALLLASCAGSRPLPPPPPPAPPATEPAAKVEEVPAVRVTQPVTKGEVLTARNLEAAQVAEDTVPSGAVADLDAGLGAQATRDLTVGEVVTRGDLRTRASELAALVGPGKRAVVLVPADVADLGAAVRGLAPEMTVELTRGTGARRGTSGTVLASDARIVVVRRVISAEQEREARLGELNSQLAQERAKELPNASLIDSLTLQIKALQDEALHPPTDSVTVEVTPAQAAAIAKYRGSGSLHIVPRRPAPSGR